jgi:preprotein translocase subunit YajC
VLTLAAEGGNGGGSGGFLITLLLMVGAMYLLFIRPQRARMRAITAAQAGLTPGSEVVLTSGIYGTVVNVDQESILLEVSPGVHLKVARGAVARVVTPQPSVEAEDDAATG